jgi:hypothetical protein
MTEACQTERYRQAGFLTGIRLFSSQQMSRWRAAFDDLEAREGPQRCRTGIKGRHSDEHFIWEMATHPRLLGLMRELLGEDLLLMSTHFFCKYPEAAPQRFVGWHQDVTYWGLEPPEAHTAWIAIDRSDRENGCMEVIPGSHRRGIVDHGRSQRPGNMLSIEQEIPSDLVEESAAVPLELDPGQASIHDGHLMHASRPNLSRRRRCGLTVRFITPNVRQAKGNSVGQQWQPILVSGEDRFGNFELASPPFPLAGCADHGITRPRPLGTTTPEASNEN